jgi:hypothetical protein
MSAFTPGPWKWDDDCVWENYDRMEHAPWLCNANLDTSILTGEIHCRSKADAALIAASPDLLAALKAIVKSLADHDDEGMIEHADQMITARAAIAKAVQA